MAKEDDDAERVEQFLQSPDLAHALASDRFKQFLDHVPVAIAVAELRPHERITYANFEFERLTGETAGEIVGKAWNALPGHTMAPDGRPLSEAIVANDDHVGIFHIARDGATISVEVWSNVIQDDDGTPLFRLVALAESRQQQADDSAALAQRLKDRDTLLRELQHRVKNNLQMITALIRLEARNLPDDETGERFDRLAGRIEALALLYRSLSEEEVSESVDLGSYLSGVASAVMRAHAVEGIHLDLQVDTWPVSVNVAMPAGLVVNELLTNALKHAFEGRAGGTISLHSIVDETGCRVVVADDGVGLAEGVAWPKTGKLGALIVQSLRQNAKARVEVDSAPGAGMRVTIFFERSDAAPADA